MASFLGCSSILPQKRFNYRLDSGAKGRTFLLATGLHLVFNGRSQGTLEPHPSSRTRFVIRWGRSWKKPSTLSALDRLRGLLSGKRGHAKTTLRFARCRRRSWDNTIRKGGYKSVYPHPSSEGVYVWSCCDKSLLSSDKKFINRIWKLSTSSPDFSTTSKHSTILMGASLKRHCRDGQRAASA
jgi:hypothetical protein